MDINIEENFLNEVDAKEKADKTLRLIISEKLINIETIKSIIKHFQSLENQNNIEVFNKIEQTISISTNSIQRIKDCIQNLSEIEIISKRTEKEWENVTNDLNKYGYNLDRLMVCNRNISILKANLNIFFKNIMENQVESLNKLFENDSNILLLYKNVRYLNYLRTIFINKIKQIKNRTKSLEIAADYLMPVMRLKENFFDKFFNYFSDIISLAETRPSFLVKLLRIIEEDSLFLISIQKNFDSQSTFSKRLNEMISLDSKSDLNNIANEGQTSFDYDEQGVLNYLIIIDKLHYFLEEKVKADFDTSDIEKKTINYVLDITLQYTKNLVKIKKVVSPCFPEKYNLFNLYKDFYFKIIDMKVNPFLQDINNNTDVNKKNSANAILAVRWSDTFGTMLKEIDIDVVSLPIYSEIYRSNTTFCEYIDSLFDESTDRILTKTYMEKQSLLEMKKKPEDITSYYASDIFQTAYNILNSLSGDIKGLFMMHMNGLIIQKMTFLESKRREQIKDISSPSNILIACVYLLESDNCISEFPNFKEKIRELIIDEAQSDLRFKFDRLNKEFINSMKICSEKVIDLIYFDIELYQLSKMFTSQWSKALVINCFDVFKSYLNIFNKIFKNQTVLMFLIKNFIQSFLEYYFEEIIHSIRSIYKKEVTKKKNTYMYNYNLRYIKSFEEGKGGENNIYNKIDVKEGKYIFPIKTIEDSWKILNIKTVKENIKNDFNNFSDLMDSFKENSLSPFSKDFDLKLDFFVVGFVNKFSTIIKIIYADNIEILNQIIRVDFKDSFNPQNQLDNAILECILFLRQPKITEEEKKVCFNSFK